MKSIYQTVLIGLTVLSTSLVTATHRIEIPAGSFQM